MLSKRAKNKFQHHCKNKVKHISKESAFAFLNLWRKKTGLSKTEVKHRPYECHFCGQWHIGKRKTQ